MHFLNAFLYIWTMSETQLLINRIFFDFSQRPKQSRGHLIPITNGFKLTGKENRANAILEGVAIGYPEFIWVIRGRMISIRVKSSDKYLRIERTTDAALHKDGFQQKFIFSIEEWRKFYDKTLKECKKQKAKSSRI